MRREKTRSVLRLPQQISLLFAIRLVYVEFELSVDSFLAILLRDLGKKPYRLNQTRAKTCWIPRGSLRLVFCRAQKKMRKIGRRGN